MNATDYDVVVVGLGPTGLTLANLLGRRGVSVLVLEREPEYYGLARAVYTDDECMRIFQTAGAAEELAADMNVDSAVQWVRSDGRVLVQFKQVDRPLSWPVVNFLYQPYLENTLERALGQYPHVTVRRGREVVGFDQDADRVNIEHAQCQGTGYGKQESEVDLGTAERVRAKFLVGCDGGRSLVRTDLGIDMTGTSFPERWLVVDLKAKEGVDAFRHLPYFDFVCDPALPTVSCPQPDGHHRFEFMLTESQTKEEMEASETVRRHISQYVNPDEVEVLRKLVYTFNAVVADRWRVGRILIAGDAAHMTPQFVGQGMGSGVRDADNLSWKLTAIIKHGASQTILDSYESERAPHAKAMIDFSVLNKSFVSIDNKLLAAGRDLALTTALRLPGLGGWIRAAKMKPRPRFRRDSYLGLPRQRFGLRGVEGTLAPQPVVRTYDGRHQRLDDVLGLGFAVLGYGVDPRVGLDAEELAALRALDTRFVTVYRFGGRPQGAAGEGRTSGYEHSDVEDHTGALTRWFGKAGIGVGGLVLLRPDRFVFGTAVTGHGGVLINEMIRQTMGSGRRIATTPTTFDSVAAPDRHLEEAR
ncbi:bifunctional 3-(3-hydroxy-phenyl)propionate/3-hydroxycinnamic acid hydroxylase MhpA [Nocardia aurantiaca]|uniref:Bifunctional 3-(3-hydroxy-phenyl)propionate/3-hydroxycinnamic acid hydroxylase n=1 Tax=Nocardia aurantiaca TaxID=2675850 RepID=A0A6I3KWS3_9NOCA|nr:bifunctional 3-(3-hydroxy-phenyl)propionate/3-hydroxycinnamic acid hydroxylase [Nocardia aurantiaca]MTE15283.1 bifunctional 3-(3-hydroxy-phenyl)propionate/3-hydroxycinnamic acid hydroxylase [Nocardia aurantiaca]